MRYSWEMQAHPEPWGERCCMWIFDSCYKGCVELWGRERSLTRASAAYLPPFYLLLKDPPEHREMIDALESRFKAKECSFRTIFGTLRGHRFGKSIFKICYYLNSGFSSNHFSH
jgi:hypothetical protein